MKVYQPYNTKLHDISFQNIKKKTLIEQIVGDYRWPSNDKEITRNEKNSGQSKPHHEEVAFFSL